MRAWLAAVVILLPLALRADTVFHVAGNGNDAWSGRLDAPNAGATDGPFATLGKARDAVRALEAAGALREPVTVQVHAGTYVLSQALVFTADDSGTEACPVTYQAPPGETVTLSGGRPVRGWQPRGDGVFTADLRAQGFDDTRFRELFWRGDRQVLARFPNLDTEHPVTGGLLYVADTAARSKNSFHCRPGEVPFAAWGEYPQAEVNLFPYHCWDHNIIRVSEVDAETGLVTLRHGVAGSIFVGNRYFVQNVLGALDAPGEWFSDWATGKLHFRPPSGTAPADGEVTVPMLENIVEFTGTPERPVEHVRLHGFRLTCARQDAVTLQGARRCRVTGNTIAGVGGVGVNVGYLRNAVKGVGLPWRQAGLVRSNLHSGDRALVFSHPGVECRVAGNDIDSTGGDGIVLGGTGNTADNNHLSRTGTYDRVCAGVTVCGDGNTVSHNVIHDVPRDGIFLNGKLNVVEYNDVRNTMLYTADNAAIALRQHDVAQAVRNRGNILRFNRLLDTIGYGTNPHCQHPGDGYASPFCSFGIYLDGSICGVTVYGNVIARCGGTGLFIQFGGDNTVENNVFVEGDAKRVQFDSMVFFGTFMFPDTAGKYRDQEPPNRIRHNIFYYGGPDTDLYRAGHWNSAEWDPRQAEFDDNLVWHGGQPVTVKMHQKLDCRSLEQWRALGYDTRSVVADPLFVDLAQDDYRLRPESPALKLGFKDINAELAKVGVYAADERASWPLTNAVLVRETPVVFRFPKQTQLIVDGFELAPVGSPPARAHVVESGTLQATDQVARTGVQSLVFIDAEGLKNPWEPHLFYNPQYTAGKVHFSVDVRNDPEQPADYYMEFRDWAGELFVGPTFRATGDGSFLVNGRLGAGGERVATVPKGEWYGVAIGFELGEAAPREYELTLTVPGRPPEVIRRPIPDARFRNVTWFGISSTRTERTVFHIDNLVIGPADDERVRNAGTALAIRGPSQRKPAEPLPPPRTDGLAGWWTFDETGLALADRSGNRLNGDLGGASRASGRFGQALYTDGGGAATVPDHPLLQFGRADFTLEAWVCPTSLEIGGDYPRRRLIEKGNYPATWWNIDVTREGRVSMEMADGNGRPGTTVSTGTLTVKKWTHLAITVDREGRKTRYYLDGQLDSTADIPAAFAGDLNVPGLPLSTGTWQPFLGLLDDLRVYRRRLSDTEVRARYDEAKARYADAAFTADADE